MGGSKFLVQCIVFIIGIVIICVIIAIMWPVIIAPRLQEATDDVLDVVPGFDSFAFIFSIVCLFPLAMILIKRKMVKKSE